VVVVDRVASTSLSSAPLDSFREFDDAQFGEVLRGVSFTPGTDLQEFHLLF